MRLQNEQEAQQLLETAKQRVEQMILGEGGVGWDVEEVR